MKPPAHRAGLPEKEVSFILCPFLPAGRQGPRLSRSWRDGARLGQISLQALLFPTVGSLNREMANTNIDLRDQEAPGVSMGGIRSVDQCHQDHCPQQPKLRGR